MSENDDLNAILLIFISESLIALISFFENLFLTLLLTWKLYL